MDFLISGIVTAQAFMANVFQAEQFQRFFHKTHRGQFKIDMRCGDAFNFNGNGFFPDDSPHFAGGIIGGPYHRHRLVNKGIQVLAGHENLVRTLGQRPCRGVFPETQYICGLSP